MLLLHFSPLKVTLFRFFLSTKYGMYAPNCGLEDVFMSWGHDGELVFSPTLTSYLVLLLTSGCGSLEYLYRVMKFNQCSIPDEVKAEAGRWDVGAAERQR